MRIKSTVIQVDFIRTFKHGRVIGAWTGNFHPTLFPGAEPGLPVSYINYAHVGLWFWEIQVMIGLRVPPGVERRNR